MKKLKNAQRLVGLRGKIPCLERWNVGMLERGSEFVYKANMRCTRDICRQQLENRHLKDKNYFPPPPGLISPDFPAFPDRLLQTGQFYGIFDSAVLYAAGL